MPFPIRNSHTKEVMTLALIGSSNAEKIWNYCIGKGLNKYGAAGLLGNLDCESALDPTNLQDSYQTKLGFTDATYVAQVDSGAYTRTQFSKDEAGFGLAQWTWWTRKQALYDFAKAKSVSIGDLEMQLDYLYKELTESYSGVLSVLLTATSVRQASDTFMTRFECPADTSEAAKVKRASYCSKYYTTFATSTGGASTMGYNTCTKGQSKLLSTHFNSTEFDCQGSGCCSTTLINETRVQYLEKIRAHFGKPITITSGYRCATHNAAVGGASGSRHTKGDAADIVVSGITPREVAQYAESIGILGIGLYETSSDGHFVHIDTRTYKSFWYGQAQASRTT